MKDPEAVAEQIRALVAAKDTSPAALATILDAMASDGSWYEDNPYYDGLSPRGWQVELWPVAVDAIKALGERAIDALVARIAAGDAILLRRSEDLGPRLVELARNAVTRGTHGLVAPAASVLARNADDLAPTDAIAMYLTVFDRHVHERDVLGDYLRDTWHKLAEPAYRDAVLARWRTGSLRPWIEARLDGPTPWHVRHIVALLAVVPGSDAMPLLDRAFATGQLGITFEPLLVVDVAVARAVIEASADVRAWAEPLALRGARGHYIGHTERERAYALVEACVRSAGVAEQLIASTEEDTRMGRDTLHSQWRAVATHLRHDASRLDRAIAAVIRNQLAAAGPGVPGPRHALMMIAELDPPRMIAAVVERLDTIEWDNNAWCFIELFTKLGPRAAAALPALERWSRRLPRGADAKDIAEAIAAVARR